MLRWLLGLALLICAVPAWAGGRPSPARECLRPAERFLEAPASEAVELTVQDEGAENGEVADPEPPNELELMLLLSHLPAGPRCVVPGPACYPDERPLRLEAAAAAAACGPRAATLLPPEGRTLSPLAVRAWLLEGSPSGVFRPPRHS